MFRAESYEEQDGLISNLFANFLPTFFENCEALLKSRGGKHFGGGDELTFGDLCAFQGRKDHSSNFGVFFVRFSCSKVELKVECLDS